MFKNLRIGGPIFLKDYDEEGLPKIRVGFYRGKDSHSIPIAYVPSLDTTVMVGFDGVNFYVDRS